jgi:hypothetical protein
VKHEDADKFKFNYELRVHELLRKSARTFASSSNAIDHESTPMQHFPESKFAWPNPGFPTGINKPVKTEQTLSSLSVVKTNQ